jgi:hypothetical protein
MNTTPLEQDESMMNLSKTLSGIEWLKELKPAKPKSLTIAERLKMAPQPILPAQIKTKLPTPESSVEDPLISSTSTLSSHSSMLLSSLPSSSSKHSKMLSPNILDPGFQMELGIPTKPNYSYATLIAYAIRQSPQKKMTLAEIYAWILENFPFYRTAGSGWKVIGISCIWSFRLSQVMTIIFLGEFLPDIFILHGLML